MTNKPKISVIIPTIERGNYLLDTISQLNKQSFKNFEVIVVDQTEKYVNPTETKIKELSKESMRYYRIIPRSVTAAKNFAIKKAKGEILIFIDDDIEIQKDFIKNHLEAYKKYPKAGAIAGRVLQDGFPIINKILRFNKYGQSEGTYTGTVDGETNTFPGGNCSVKRNIALRVKGFDTRYYGGSFREESDFANKVHSAGYKIYYYHKAEIFHLAAPSGGNRVKTHIYDNPSFYANEMFFTLRFVSYKNLIKSLKYKFSEYCMVARGKTRYKRGVLFILGILRAFSRLILNKQTIAKEFR